MIDERAIVAAILRDRRAYDSLAGRLDPKDFGAQAELIVKVAGQFYRRDAEAMSVDAAVLQSSIPRHFANPKHAAAVLSWLEDLPAEVSAVNLAAEYKAMRRHKVGLELAAKLASGAHGDAFTDKLVEKYRLLGVDEEAQAKPRLTIDELAETVGEGRRIKLMPGALNDAAGGGALRGHNILVYARPDVGKTMFVINLGAGFIRQGLTVLYTGNEEPIADVQKRFLSRMSGVGHTALNNDRAELERAVELAETAGYDRLIAQALTTAKVAEVEALVRRYKPDVLIVDQLRNLKINGGGNRALELDIAAREIRGIGKAYNVLTVPVTQAGDSAEGKLYLEMGDVEWSNTGVQGQADLMIGIGCNDNYHATGRRAIALPKNKLGGKHARLTLFVEPDFNLYRSTPRK